MAQTSSKLPSCASLASGSEDILWTAVRRFIKTAQPDRASHQILKYAWTPIISARMAPPTAFRSCFSGSETVKNHTTKKECILFFILYVCECVSNNNNYLTQISKSKHRWRIERYQSRIPLSFQRHEYSKRNRRVSPKMFVGESPEEIVYTWPDWPAP